MSVQVDKKHSEFYKSVKVAKPVKSRAANPSARVLDAIERKEELIAVKSFKAGGQSFEIGDRIPASLFIPEQASGMAEHGYILPASEYDAGQVYFTRKKYYEQVLNPAYQRVMQHEAMVAHAEQVIQDRIAALRAAEEALANSKVRLSEVEADYLLLVDGELIS